MKRLILVLILIIEIIGRESSSYSQENKELIFKSDHKVIGAYFTGYPNFYNDDRNFIGLTVEGRVLFPYKTNRAIKSNHNEQIYYRRYKIGNFGWISYHNFRLDNIGCIYYDTINSTDPHARDSLIQHLYDWIKLIDSLATNHVEVNTSIYLTRNNNNELIAKKSYVLVKFYGEGNAIRMRLKNINKFKKRLVEYTTSHKINLRI